MARAEAGAARKSLVLHPAPPADASPDAHREAPAPQDVWSWTGTKYRARSFTLLAVNFLLFCGLCVFTNWLHVARPFDFTLESYLTPMRLAGGETQNLNDFVLYPISVLQTPIHAVVLGLLMASIVAVPILIAILYRFHCAVPFALAVGVFAHLPWMAFTLLLSCTLAAVRPFRMSFRYGSALVAMLPVLLYLYLATMGRPDQAGGDASPAQRSLLMAPWVLAILAACAMMATVLLISRAVNYRPDGVSPVMALMFATPVVLFYSRVGVDELHYRVLEAKFGPLSPLFETKQDAEPRLRELMRRLTNDEVLYDRHREEVLAALSGEPAPIKRLLWQRMQAEFLADREAAYQAYAKFIADHPNSRYLPNVYYMQARALDTRLDPRKLHALPPSRELYSDFPHVQSEKPWTSLLVRHGDSPLAIAAGLRLAQLHLRTGRLDAAVRELESLLDLAATVLPQSPDTQPSAGMLRPPAPERGLNFEPLPYVLEARRLLELVTTNAADPRYGAAPLVALLSLDPHLPGYADQLLHVAASHPDALIYDNVLVAWVGTVADATARAAAYAAIIERFPTGDGMLEAAFRLGELETQSRGADAEQRRQRGIARLRELATGRGETYWGLQASERLALLEPRAAEATAR